jgi:hypothetical protein
VQRKPLQRHTRLKRNPRSKGSRGELEVRELLRARGYTSAKRNLQSGGQGGGDLIEAIPGYGIEVKRVEDLNIWRAFKQSFDATPHSDTATVVFRRNNSPWWIAAEERHLLGLLADSDVAVHRLVTERLRLWVELQITAAAAGIGQIPTLLVRRPSIDLNLTVIPFDTFLDLTATP